VRSVVVAKSRLFNESRLAGREFYRRLVDEFVDDALLHRFLFGSCRLLVLPDFDSGGLPR
jgi:hypothetical protein